MNIHDSYMNPRISFIGFYASKAVNGSSKNPWQWLTYQSKYLDHNHVDAGGFGKKLRMIFTQLFLISINACSVHASFYHKLKPGFILELYLDKVIPLLLNHGTVVSTLVGEY